jgi:hypothetical protein
MRKETASSTAMREGIEALRHMTVGQLKQKYDEVFGEASRSNHKQFLFRRIAWRMQANAWGGLSERARRRAQEIADDADLRIRAPRNFLKVELDESRTIETRLAPTEDPRLPMPGTMLVRRYRGKDIVVRVGDEVFPGEHEAIIDQPTFELAQVKLKDNTWKSGNPHRIKMDALLRGMDYTDRHRGRRVPAAPLRSQPNPRPAEPIRNRIPGRPV